MSRGMLIAFLAAAAGALGEAIGRGLYERMSGGQDEEQGQHANCPTCLGSGSVTVYPRRS